MEINMFLPQKDCTGCAACMNQCPANCISMQSDEEGFLRPVIDAAQCVACGACKEVCPVLAPQEPVQKTEPVCYAAWSRDPNIRFQSTSGGIFTHFARAILSQGGCVVGAKYKTDHLVEHAAAATESELEALRQSKYVQSEVGLIYRDIETKLKQGMLVLFSGTPCQCAGLRAYLKQEYENLYLCDFICRGVNSPKVYLAYLQELEERYGSPVKQVWFKNKTYGWNNFCTKIVFRDGQEYLADRETDPFMLGYIKSKLNLYMRPSCYQCKFKGIARPVDITLGDFWGVQLQNADADADSGVSAVMIHSPKGKLLFEKASEMLDYEERACNQLLSGNRCILESVVMTTERDHFWKRNSQQTISFSKAISTFYRKENHL